MNDRELDERVARAIENDPGWDMGFWIPPAYSSDWSCCEEMLAWLTQDKESQVSIANCCSDGWCAQFSTTDYFEIVNGATLPLALARLVCAVAAAKEKKQ